MRFAVTAVLLAILVSAAPTSAGAMQQFVDVRHVATDTLRDVAMTVVGTGRPTIYYNPTLMQRIGPKLEAFAMAHEYGHVRYGHTGALLADASAHAHRHRQELEADCYAARILDANDPEALKTAVQFFSSMGPFRYDALHPSGAQRAEKIRSCVAADGSKEPSP